MNEKQFKILKTMLGMGMDKKALAGRLNLDATTVTLVEMSPNYATFKEQDGDFENMVKSFMGGK